jgi:hypothetical protein
LITNTFRNYWQYKIYYWRYVKIYLNIESLIIYFYSTFLRHLWIDKELEKLKNTAKNNIKSSVW